MSLSLVAGLLSAPPALAAPGIGDPLAKERVTPVRPAGKGGQRPAADTDQRGTPKATVWPVAGSAVVDLSGPASTSRAAAPAGKVKAGALPVRVGIANGAGESQRAVRGAAASTPTMVNVDMLDRSRLAKSVTSGVALTVTRADEGAATGAVALELDYSGFAQAFGGGYGSRLRWVRMPACAATTPELPECQSQTPLTSTNDPGTQTVTADVAVGAPVALKSTMSASAATSAAPVYALAATSSGPSGDFARTPLQESATWTAGTSGGDFSWQYSMKVPPPAAGPQPVLGVSYSSGATDGKTGAANGQNSWVGEGMDLNPGFVERQYASCVDDGGSTNDLCWRNDNITISLGGQTQRAFRDSPNNPVWKGEFDPGWKIEQCGNWYPVANCEGAISNGTHNREYWRVTTPDGTQYNFGKTLRFAGDTIDTKSTLTVPVFGNNPGDPCYNAAGFASSWCRMGWRWNLDYVVDPRGNTMTYFYDLEWHKYGLNNNSVAAGVDRGSTLEHIEYGTRVGQEGSGLAPFKVDFERTYRCYDQSPSACVQSNPGNWLDVPWDLACDYTASTCPGKTSPVFFTSKKLSKITAKVRDFATGTYVSVDEYALDTGYVDSTDASGWQLWLFSITHTGINGANRLSLPPTVLAGNRLNNRADTSKPSVKRMRLEWIVSETGGITWVGYSTPNCDITKSAIDNNQPCFQQKSRARVGEAENWEFWNKYTVVRVIERDRHNIGANDDRPEGGSPDVVTDYSYSLASTESTDSRPPVLWGFAQNFMASYLERSWSDWRGYSDVTVTRGVGSAAPQVTKKKFYRGLSGDRAVPNNTAWRHLVLRNSENWPNEDIPAYRGQLAEEQVYDGTTIRSYTIYDKTPPHQQVAQTGLPDGTTGYSNWVRDRGARAYTKIDTPSSWRVAETKAEFDNDGQVTVTFDLGDPLTVSDDICATVMYTQDRSRWMLALPGITETRIPVGSACTGTRLSGGKTFYGRWDNPADSPGSGLPVRTEVLSDAAAGTYITSGHTDFDALGRPIKVYDVLERATTTGYTPGLTAAGSNPVTQIVVTNPAGHTATGNLDWRTGAPITITDANGKTTEAEYDLLGRLVKVWTPGRPKAANLAKPDTSYEYVLDPAKLAMPYVRTTRLAPNDNLISTFESYDGLLRLRQTQVPSRDGGAAIAATTYDSAGHAIKSRAIWANLNPSGGLVLFDDKFVPSQHAFEYDKLGRQTRDTLLRGDGQNITEVSHTEWAFDGDRVTVTPSAGALPSTTYTDVRGRVTKVRQQTGGNQWQDSTYGYDLLGRQTTVADGQGNSWTTTYDTLGRVLSKTDPDTGTSTFSYDNAGQVLTSTDARGVKLAYQIDNLGRKTGLFRDSTAGVRLATWAYDTLAKGQLTSSTRHNSAGDFTTTVTGYDDGYRPLGTKITIPASQGTLAGEYTSTSTYRANGAPATRTYPSVGALPAETLTYSYNAIGQPTSTVGLETYISDVAYYFDGAVKQTTFGTGGKQVRVSAGRDETTLRMTTAQVDTERTGTPGTFDELYTEKYAYDQVGNVLGINETKAAATISNQCFSYDGLRRMTESWTTAAGACQSAPSTGVLGGADPYWTSYTFDPAGGRAAEVKHAAPGGGIGTDTTRTYTTPGAGQTKTHSLTKIDTKVGTAVATTTDSFTYDDAGNTSTHNTSTYTWNEIGKLSQVAVSGGGATTDMVYDADGSRILRKDSTGTTLYLGGMELHADTLASAVTGTRYYPGAVRTTTGGLVWMLADHHGTSQTSIKASDLTVTRRRTDPFGGARGAAVAWPTQKGFVDGVKDPDTGLIHIGAREYNPTLGRFISVDPVFDLADPQSWHGYAYANNAPATSSDPTGLQHEMDGGPGGGCGATGCKENSPIVIPYEGGTVLTVTPATSEDPDRTFYIGNIGFAYGHTDVYTLAAEFDDALGGKDPNKMTPYEVLTLLERVCKHSETGCASDLSRQIQDAANEEMLAMHKGEHSVLGEIGTAVVNTETGAGNPCNSGSSKYCGMGPKGTSGVKRLGCNSFAADTNVLMADGTTKAISQIKLGDDVLATDPGDGKTRSDEVSDLHLNVDYELTDVFIQSPNGTTEVIHTTVEHPFWTVNGKLWVEAGSLHAGDGLRTPDGSVVVVVRVDNFHGYQPMFNLTIGEFHTYYVLAGAIPLLVHNAPRCTPGPGLGPAYLSDKQWDHIKTGHFPTGSPAADDGIFLGDEATVKSRIFDAIHRGRSMKNTDGRPGFTYTVDFQGYEVGYKVKNKQRTNLYFYTVVVVEGRIVTAYPH
ncbi:polymorphic toxin-type HINT domain-containing protein [Longispora sp. K20-0274]|uniref:polymorphic toxin-type HINT domain-containing protein n=1 Tax=Longispora sp. K20-0274 TaxID=3088255 RepID=UPI00399BFF89